MSFSKYGIYLSIVLCVSFDPTKLDDLYHDLMLEAKQPLKAGGLVRETPPIANPPPPKSPLSSSDSPVDLFNKQGFTLWLSPVSSEEADLASYYKDIVTFCTSHGIKKVIWYLGYTNASAPFYDPASTDPTSFVQLLNHAPLPFGCTMELRIECASMDNGPIYAPSTPPPVLPSYTTLPVYMSSRNLAACLWLVRDLYTAANKSISGVTIDPQDNCDETPSYTPYTSVSEATQAIVNYLDEFASVNPDFYPLNLGMTFDGSAKTVIFGNRSKIPVEDEELINDTNTIVNFYNGQGNGDAPWTRPNPTAPFLDIIYPQLYNISSDYLYTLSGQPSKAGLNFLQLLSETPYCPGTTSEGDLSTISFSSTSPVITGSGTQFATELTTSVNANSPLGFISATGMQMCLLPNNDPRYPQTLPSVACTGKISTVTDNEHATLNANPSSNQSNVPWLYVENEINYREYYVTPAMIDGLYLMFSSEGDFFGGWSLEQFMGFVTAFYEQGQSYSLYVQDPGISTSSIPVPNQFALFTYEQMTGRASPSPSNIWFPGE